MTDSLIPRIVDGRTDLVVDLLDGGRPATATDDRGTPLIRWCAYYGDVTAVRMLLDRGAPSSSLGVNLGLHDAAFHGHWRLCQFLIERGADVNLPIDETGETALHAATCKANRPAYTLVIEVLLAHGAQPDAITKPGVGTGAFMRDARTKGETPLHRAAAFGTEEAIRMLLDAGARRDARDAHGDTPLSWASWHLRPDRIIRLLCHDGFTIHPDRNSTFDHGLGWGEMERSLLGKPHV